MLIQDIKPATKPKTGLDNYQAEEMIAALWHRGISLEQIFAQFYAMEAAADARDDEVFGSSEAGLHGRLTVGDAELAGMIDRLPPKPTRRQPF